MVLNDEEDSEEEQDDIFWMETLKNIERKERLENERFQIFKKESEALIKKENKTTRDLSVFRIEKQHPNIDNYNKTNIFFITKKYYYKTYYYS